MRRALIPLVLALAAGCGDRPTRSAGQRCVGSSECDDGLICDFGQQPAVCREVGSNRPAIDAEPTPNDASTIDAAAAR